MALNRMVVELGMGVDLQGEDYTKAACRAVHNALRQNSLTVAPAFGCEREWLALDQRAQGTLDDHALARCEAPAAPSAGQRWSSRAHRLHH